MQVTINGEMREYYIDSVGTLLDLTKSIEETLPQGKFIMGLALNGKQLDHLWYQTADKVYLLNEDTLEVSIGDSTLIGREALKNSKEQFQKLLDDFRMISNSFRIKEEKEANSRFVQGIENLQYFIKLLEDAAALLGRPLKQIIIKEEAFSKHLDDIALILDLIIKTQNQKDWVMLADNIEYEMLPAIEKLGLLYDILEI